MFAICRGAKAALLGAACCAIVGPRLVAAEPTPAVAPVSSQAESNQAESNQAAAGEAASLDSPAWRETLGNWREWLASEKRYTAAEAEQLQQELDAQLAGMTTGELAAFKADLDAKLALLNGQLGREYRQWVNETLAVASESYARKFRAELPDFARMSAAEVQAALDRFDYERSQVEQYETAYHRSQGQRAAAVREELQYQREASQRAADRIGRNASLQAHFAVAPQSQPTIRQYHSQRGYGYYGYGFPSFWFFLW